VTPPSSTSIPLLGERAEKAPRLPPDGGTGV
jgi:hypothetical protein